MGATAFLLLLVLGFLLAFAGGIIGLVESFRVSTTWGLLCLFVPFAALVFIVKFWNRKWVRNSLFMGLGGSAMMLLSALTSGMLLAQRDVPTLGEEEVPPVVEGVPLPDDNVIVDEPGQEEFAEPLVPGAPNLSPLASTELIRSTDPNERVQQIQQSRTDPFAPLPIPPKPRVVAPPPTVPAQAPPSVAANPQPGAGAAAAGGTGGGQAAAGSGSQPGAGGANRPSGGGANGGNGGAITAPPQLPPATSLASAVSVSGVVKVGGDTFAIVNAPGESTSRYVKVGQRVSNGKVLVKRIELGGGSEPVVILEENGIEVARPVGGSPEGSDEASPAAMAASSTGPIQIPQQDYLIR